jgi:hypothetical protein
MIKLGLGLVIALVGSALKGQVPLPLPIYTGPSALTGSYIINPGTSVTFNSGYTFQATTNLTLGNYAYLYWNQNGPLTGTAITSGTTAGNYGYINVGNNNALTLDSATTLTGDVYVAGTTGATFTNQGTITHTSGTGNVYAPTLNNSGAITATSGTLYLGYPSPGYNSTVYLRGNFDNNSTLTAQNSGVLLFDGSNTTANLGTVVLATGGRARLNGILDNTAATLNAPTGGTYELYGGTINGGTIAAGALTFTTSSGTLNGATLLGDLSLLSASVYVYFAGGSTFTGANATFASSSGVYWQQAGTLTGKTLSMASGSYIYITGVGHALTLDPTTTATGVMNFYSDGSAGTAFTNQGTLNHTSGSGSIYSLNFINSGAITATAGTLYLGYPSAAYNTTNTGTVVSDGSGTTVYLRGPFDNNGTLTAQNSGVLLFDGSNTTANLGTVVLATGGRDADRADRGHL